VDERLRLNQNQIKAITALAKEHFSDEVQVYLFGCRTDERKIDVVFDNTLKLKFFSL
jgi:hypothetical protein